MVNMLKASVLMLILLVIMKMHAQGVSSAKTSGGISSVSSSLSFRDCKEIHGEDQVGEITYWECSGAAGYSLQINLIDSGQLSVDVITPAKRRLPLNYSQVVTSSMNDVGSSAEWRMRTDSGKTAPIAVIIPVLVHGNQRNPAAVTSVYWVLAKIASDSACVTDRIRKDFKTAEEMHALADSAASRPCLSPLHAPRHKKL